jgi:hypothetical protein
MFSFEKRTKKLLLYKAALKESPRQRVKFFASFFQKRSACLAKPPKNA